MSPRDDADGAAGQGSRGNPETPGGQKAASGTAGDASPGNGSEDFVLSEETLHTLPQKERVVASRLLRLERENAEMRADLARAENGSNGDDDEDEDDGGRDLEEEIEAVLSEIPEEGYENMSKPLKKILRGLIRENETLRQGLEKAETEIGRAHV